MILLNLIHQMKKMMKMIHQKNQKIMKMIHQKNQKIMKMMNQVKREKLPMKSTSKVNHQMKLKNKRKNKK